MSNIHKLIPDPDSAGFDAFWKQCPLKVGKLVAKAKFDAITSPKGLNTRILDKTTGEYLQVHVKASAAELTAAMASYRRTRIDPKTYDIKPYTLHPATWLNCGRWLDDV